MVFVKKDKIGKTLARKKKGLWSFGVILGNILFMLAERVHFVHLMLTVL